MKIPFNRAQAFGDEVGNIQRAIADNKIGADGQFSKFCEKWLVDNQGVGAALVTNSCSSALLISQMLADVGPGDEVILPSYTFTSTANAIVMRGGTPVFIDIREDTLNMDERLIDDAITRKTKAICPVHYAGVACEMETITATARYHNLVVIEDAAQGLLATYQGKPLGSIGDLGAISFHETKNIICGEGGALLIGNARYRERAEVIRDKGANRRAFFRGQVDKYTWIDAGSAFSMSDLAAAFLAAQLERAAEITRRRLLIWDGYWKGLEQAEARGIVRRPRVPAGCVHNAHMFYLLMNTAEHRDHLIKKLAEKEIQAVTHYVPLHSAPAGVRFGRANGAMTVTDRVGDTLVRLPLWVGLEHTLDEVVDAVLGIVRAF